MLYVCYVAVLCLLYHLIKLLLSVTLSFATIFRIKIYLCFPGYLRPKSTGKTNVENMGFAFLT